MKKLWEDEYESFRCPNCNQYISSKLDECRFCKTILPPETKLAAVEGEKKDVRKYRRNHHLKHLAIGIGVLVLGILINFLLLSALVVGFHATIIFYGVILYGIGEIAYGCYGLIYDIFHR
ncbi:MAG: hypothetical protein ACR2GD_12360 [Pyrinomonadaceae bacterium]